MRFAAPVFSSIDLKSTKKLGLSLDLYERSIPTPVRDLSEARREAAGAVLKRRRTPPSLYSSQPLQGRHGRFAYVDCVRLLSGTWFSGCCANSGS